MGLEMTSAVQSASVAAAWWQGWPDDDVAVLRSRTLRPGTSPAGLSRFADPVWKIGRAHPDAHYVVNAIRWERFPQRFVLPFKAFALAALDHCFPLDLAVGRVGERPNVATVGQWVVDLLAFAAWLDDRGIRELPEVTDRDLEAYRAHVMELPQAAARKARMFNAVRALWDYRDQMPAQCHMSIQVAWSGTSGHQLASAVTRSRENRTPRIAPPAMEALLAWALRIAEDIGPEIRDAWITYRQLDQGVHHSQRRYDGLLMRDRVRLFLSSAQSDGSMLPGRVADEKREINWSHLGRILGQYSSWSPARRRPVLAAALPIADGSPVGAITGQIDGRPWRDRPITVQELPELIRILSAACFVTACYLSGGRPGEILNLQRGCTSIDEATGEYLFRGRAGKGNDRPADGEDAGRTWVTVQPAHAALTMMESLSGHRFVSPPASPSPAAAGPTTTSRAPALA
jgi:hypothetical protein